MGQRVCIRIKRYGIISLITQSTLVTTAVFASVDFVVVMIIFK